MGTNVFTNQSAFPLRVLGILFCILWVAPSLSAQKVIVLTDADIKQEVAHAHSFSYDAAKHTFTVKHRFSRLGAMQVTEVKPNQLARTNYTLKSKLPLTLNPGETQDIVLSVDYSNSIRGTSTMHLLVYPVGDKAPAARGVTVKLLLSASGRPMFWNERARKYTANLPTLEFNGSGDKLIELTWNGNGSGTCTYGKENDTRNSFFLVPNRPGAQAIAPGASIPLGTGGRSYFVRYDGAGKRIGSSDQAQLTFREATTGEQLNVGLYGTYKGGPSLFAAAQKVARNVANGGNDNQVGGPNSTKDESALKTLMEAAKNRGNRNTNDGSMADGGVGEGTTPGDSTNETYNWVPLGQAEKDVKTAARDYPGYVEPITSPGPNASGNTPVTSTQPRPPVARPRTPTPTPAQPGRVYTIEEAQTMLQGIYDRRSGENLIVPDETHFKSDEEGKYSARFLIELDSLKEDPNLHIDAIWVAALADGDSVGIPMTNVSYDPDSSILQVILSEEVIEEVASQDSFSLMVGFMPEYMAGNTPVHLVEQTQIFRGKTIGRLHYESNWLLWLWILLGTFIALVFFLGWMWVRQPIKSFRYLRESRYQRDRYRATSEGHDMDIETVYLDLSRQDTDLVQLAFMDRGDGPVAPNQEAGYTKRLELEATVTEPRKRGLKRFFIWFYGIFGMSKEPRFRAVYYSLRIEMVPGGIPQHLRLKDENGLILLGTSLTGNVLATDHQDFRFTKRPFMFRVYMDPAEILDYTGAMRTVSLPFRVIEEPFEGYVITREFNLDMEIAPKY